MRTLALFLCLGGCLALTPGCDDNSGADMGTHDMSASSHDMSSIHDMAFQTLCGKPGDTGNSKGVGKFCNTNSDCSGNGQATVCSALFHPGTHFCTVPTTCTAPVDTTTCGENTVCQCDPNLGCGCTPADCAMPQG